MVPPEGLDHPMATLLLSMLREAKKDLRRMPAELIEKLSRPIGQAFTWVADGGEIPNESDNSIEDGPGDDDDSDDDPDFDDDDSDDFESDPGIEADSGLPAELAGLLENAH